MLNIGATVGDRYVVESVVGHGGMGTIYRAQDTRLGRTVALKVLRADLAADQVACAHFLREGQIAAQMVHANVVRTYDAGEDLAGPFLVQELLSGRTLDQIIPLSPQQAASILSDVAAALSYIHSRGYLHCDIKPQNILIKHDGTPILLDFGIARAEGLAATTLIATPHYLAPERAHGGPPTVVADLYALGIVLFQAIEGHPPFEATTIPALIQQHNDLPMPSLSIADPLNPVLNSVLARLTAKQPNARYQSAATVREDLAAIGHDAGHAFPTLAVSPSPPLPETHTSNVVAPTRSPRPPSQHLQQAATAWSTLPAWRKRRWFAYVAGALLVLSLGYALARGNGAEAQPVPDSTQPSSLEVQPTQAIVEPPSLEVQPTQVIVEPANLETQPTEEVVPEVVAPAEPASAEPIQEVSTPAANQDIDLPDDATPAKDGGAKPPGKDKGKDDKNHPGKDKGKERKP